MTPGGCQFWSSLRPPLGPGCAAGWWQEGLRPPSLAKAQPRHGGDACAAGKADGFCGREESFFPLLNPDVKLELACRAVGREEAGNTFHRRGGEKGRGPGAAVWPWLAHAGCCGKETGPALDPDGSHQKKSCWTGCPGAPVTVSGMKKASHAQIPCQMICAPAVLELRQGDRCAGYRRPEIRWCCGRSWCERMNGVNAVEWGIPMAEQII